MGATTKQGAEGQAAGGPPVATTTAVATTPQNTQATKLRQWHGMLLARKEKYRQVLPPDVPVETFIGNAVAYLWGNPDILSWEPESVFRAVMETARLGLMPHGIIPGVHLVGFWNSRKGVREAVPVTDYRALVDLAVRSGGCRAVKALPVYVGDTFVYEEGMVTRLEHRWDLDKSDDGRGAFRGAYAVATLADGSTTCVWLNRAQIDAVRDAVLNRNRGSNSPWNTDYVAMALKTVVRRVLNLIPKSALRLNVVGRALELEARAERGDAPPVDPDDVADALPQAGSPQTVGDGVRRDLGVGQGAAVAQVPAADLAAARAAGAAALQAGADWRTNPHTGGSLRTAWRDGWVEAQDERAKAAAGPAATGPAREREPGEDDDVSGGPAA